MNTEPQCPPCNQDCRQGRNCPAYGYAPTDPEPDVDFMFWSIVVLGTMCLCAFCVWVGTML